MPEDISWQEKLEEQLPLLGHRNWILIVDSAYPLQNASGKVITSPLITPGLFLDAINAGWEIDTGTSFTNQAFCVAMQSEADCP